MITKHKISCLTSCTKRPHPHKDSGPCFPFGFQLLFLLKTPNPNAAGLSQEKNGDKLSRSGWKQDILGLRVLGKDTRKVLVRRRLFKNTFGEKQTCKLPKDTTQRVKVNTGQGFAYVIGHPASTGDETTARINALPGGQHFPDQIEVFVALQLGNESVQGLLGPLWICRRVLVEALPTGAYQFVVLLGRGKRPAAGGM